MKAYVLHGVNDLRLEDRPVPEIKSGWALVRVLAAGICSSDIPRIFEKGTYKFPTIPGHEFCGIVEQTADEKDRKWVGRRVGIFPLIPCRKCGSCSRGEYETCEHYDYIGSRRDGAFAEYVAVPVWNLIELPDNVSNLEGAMLEPAAVACHAVRRLGNIEGKSVCVVGTGAIGMLVGQWAKIRHADRVIIKGRSETKRTIAESCGLEYVAGTNAKFDCVVEAVGSPDSIKESIALAGPNGKIVLMGNPVGDITLPQDIYWKILRKQLDVLGTWNSSYGGGINDWSETVQTLASGKIFMKPLVTHLFPGHDLQKGLKVMKEKEEKFCKVIVEFKSDSQSILGEVEK